MLQLIETANNHETTPSEQNVMPLVNEIFNTVENGQVPNIPPLISAGFLRNNNGETLLIVGARCGYSTVVDRFRNEIDVDEVDSDGWSALLCASHHGHADCVRLLLEAYASIDQPDYMGWTSLMWACYKNRLKVVNVLLEYNAHINIVGEEDGLTPLIIASGRGFTDVVNCLLCSGAEVNSSDKFGSTSLIWAARKGFFAIVEQLLAAGADVDAIGMYNSTALMLATRGCHLAVVKLLLSRDPNVNVVDYNGLSALAIAAREGYTEIAQHILGSGAYVNTIDRFGNSILASAIRSGNIQLVRMLLEKHADVNVKDSENRTPLHLAIDKSYADIVLALLEKKPNLEQKNKDGDTALIRAVKNRDVGLCQLLVHSGAKISAVDNAGENSLHLALRARSRRLAQILLVNPGDSKLLYRPNKVGETPYSIDQESSEPILPTIFGPIGVDVDLKNLLGFEAYSDVLADIVCEPNLTLPLTIGLFAKWGSGKSFLLPKISESMKSFSRSWLDGSELYWSWSLVLICFIICAVMSLAFMAVIVPLFEDVDAIWALLAGAVIYVLIIAAYGFIYYGSEIKLWNGSIMIARFIARSLARLKLIINVATLNVPIRTDKELIMSPVSFLFADNNRLSFVGGEQTLSSIVSSLFNAAEEHYGAIPVRLYSAFKTQNQSESKLRTLCGVPVLVQLTLFFFSFIIALLLLVQYSNNGDSNFFIGMVIFSGMCLFFAIPPFYVFIMQMLVSLPQRRIRRLTHRANLLPFERLIQKLQREVDLLTSMINSLNAFTKSQTRLVVMVDGLDNCEQHNMVQILDALTLFFGSRQNAPYIVIIAADPHIIVAALQNNLRTGTNFEITGYDYMKNTISMPFYLHSAALQQLQRQVKPKSQSSANGSWLERKHSANFRGSRLSLREKEGLSAASQNAAKENLTNSLISNKLSNMFPSHDYFLNLNPRLMRRIVNSIALTGRLLRFFEVEFSWFLLYTWISLLEQWPFRMTFLVDCALDNPENLMTISELYERMKSRLPTKSSLTELDRNPMEFDQIIKRLGMSKNEQLNVEHLKLFSPCTSNLDPYLKKLIHEQTAEEFGGLNNVDEDREVFPFAQFEQHHLLSAQFLFSDPNVWATVLRPLPKMSVDDICDMVERSSISADQIGYIVECLRQNNLNGLALNSCSLDELKSILKLSLGDWTMLKLLIEALRVWRPPTKRTVKHESSIQRGVGGSQSTRTASNLMAGDDRELTSLLSIREEGASPMPSPVLNIQDKAEASMEAYSSDYPMHDFRFEHDVEVERNSVDDNDDADSLRSNAGSRQSLLNYSENIARD